MINHTSQNMFLIVKVEESWQSLCLSIEFGTYNAATADLFKTGGVSMNTQEHTCYPYINKAQSLAF